MAPPLHSSCPSPLFSLLLFAAAAVSAASPAAGDGASRRLRSQSQRRSSEEASALLPLLLDDLMDAAAMAGGGIGNTTSSTFEITPYISPGFANATEVNYLLPSWQQYQPNLAVVTAHSVDDVRKLVDWVRDNRKREGTGGAGGQMSPVGGRHSGAGYAFGGEMVAVELGPALSEVEIVVATNNSNAVVRVGAGATLGDVIDALNGTSGYVTATGVCAGVGIGGWTLGGGYSPFAKFFGLGSDGTVEMDVVLADGSLVTANETSHPDLFWALRGGGHQSFGHVVSLTKELHPLRSHVEYRVTVPCEEDPLFCAAALDEWYRQYYFNETWIDSKLATYSWSMMMMASNSSSSAGITAGDDVISRPIVLTWVFVYASDGASAAEEMEAVLEPFTEFLRKDAAYVEDGPGYVVSNFASIQYIDDPAIESIDLPAYEPKVGLYIKRNMTSGDWRQLVHAALTVRELFEQPEPVNGMYFVFEPYVGRVVEVASDYNAHFHREQVSGDFYLDIFTKTTMGPNDTQTPEEAYDVGMGWLEGLYQTGSDGSSPPKLDGLLFEHGGRFQSYVNYRQKRFGEGDQRWPALQSYYGGNLCRLIEVKRTYDPDLLFDFPQGIPLDAPDGECPNLLLRKNSGDGGQQPSEPETTSSAVSVPVLASSSAFAVLVAFAV